MVRDDSQGLVFTWPADGGFGVADRLSEVPPGKRNEVRVQDTARPPGRDRDWIFLADLSTRLGDGTYKVKSEKRDAYEQKHRPPPPAAPPKETPAVGPGGIVMYMTPHCPVCRKAREWLRSRNIIFTEKNVESDTKAQAELSAKAQAQGVELNGVPVFDIRGKIVSGFNEDQILKLLGAK